MALTKLSRGEYATEGEEVVGEAQRNNEGCHKARKRCGKNA